MEVRESRVEGTVQVYTVVISVNMMSQTIEQIIGKRRKVVIDMVRRYPNCPRATLVCVAWSRKPMPGSRVASPGAVRAARRQGAFRGAVGSVGRAAAGGCGGGGRGGRGRHLDSAGPLPT